MIDVALVVLQMALQIALPWLIVRSDMRRLPPDALARSWNDASFWSAIVVFGALSVPVHFVKSRRSLLGLTLGLLWLGVAVTVVVAVNWVVLQLFG